MAYCPRTSVPLVTEMEIAVTATGGRPSSVKEITPAASGLPVTLCNPQTATWSLMFPITLWRSPWKSTHALETHVLCWRRTFQTHYVISTAYRLSARFSGVPRLAVASQRMSTYTCHYAIQDRLHDSDFTCKTMIPNVLGANPSLKWRCYGCSGCSGPCP